MGCEESFITMKFIWHDYLVFSLGICVHKTTTKTGLIENQELEGEKKSPDYFSKKKTTTGGRSDVVDVHTPGAAPGMRISFLFWNWVHAAGKMRYTCLQSGKGASVRCQ